MSLFLFIGVPLLIYCFLSDFVKIKDNTEIAIIEITELMKGLNSIALAFVALVAAPFAIWRMSLTHRQTKTAEKQADTQLQSHHTENYFKAVIRLTSKEDIIIRTGAIHALSKIARESQNHHKQIMEVFCFFIRRRTKEREQERTQENFTDIQAAFNALANRNKEWSGEALPDLQGANFQKINFYEGDFERIMLTNAHFERADLYEANFEGADLGDTYFEGANLGLVNFKGANLVGADLSNAQNLKQEQIANAFGDRATKLPKGFSFPGNWYDGKLGLRDHKAWKEWQKSKKWKKRIAKK